LHINYKERRLEEEGGRISGTYTVGEPAFSQRRRDRDQYNHLKRDTMLTLGVLQTTMSTASLAATSDMQQIEQRNKRLKRHIDNALEEEQEEKEDSNNA
jgi:hypothetical protein